jgi:histidine phosphotransferase ChpT
MTLNAAGIDDLELASLISSKICHDVIGPVGAIFNGLEVLDDNADEESRELALGAIRDFTQQASAKLQFARFAFGAAGSAGAVIDLGNAEAISRGFIGSAKHTLHWAAPRGQMGKDRAKLLLNMVANGQAALPKGGEIHVGLAGSLDAPELEVRCKGQGARAPQHLPEFLAGVVPATLDALTIQAYYTVRLAKAAGMRLEVRHEAGDVVMVARPLG